MKKILTGKIISAKMNKSVVVQLERKFRHPLYRKVITRHNKIKAHNEKLKLKENDVVKIQEAKPFSKDINFIVIEKISK